jgi:hypothetical protein
MKSGSWQGNDIRGMIRKLVVNCTPILDSTHNAVKTVAEIPSDEMVMGAGRSLCKFCLLVSAHNHSDLSLTALDDTPKRFYKKKGALLNQKMLMSAKAKLMNYPQENPISYMNRRFIKSVAEWGFSCMGLQRLLYQNDGNFRCA